MLAKLIALALAGAPPSSAGCPMPEVAAPSGGDDFAKRFAGSTTAYRQTRNNIAAAFRRACARGLMARDGLLGVTGGAARSVILSNAPEANIAALMADELPDGTNRLALEYRFLGGDGSVNVPSADDIEEAVFCAVRGASEQEQEESGRCLPD